MLYKKDNTNGKDSKIGTVSENRSSNKDLVLQPLFMAAEGGKLYHYDFASDSLSLVFEDERKETMMGLVKNGDDLYVGAKTRVHKLNIHNGHVYKYIKSSKELLKRKFSLRKRDPGFHQISIIEDFLYVTSTGFNEIWKMDLDLNLVKAYKIRPPRRFLPVRYKWNYNHLNNIIFHNDKFYVCLNWLTSKQYGPSGVAVLNSQMREVERFEYGWETHNFSIFGGRRYVLVASSGAIKQVDHPHRGGLMVDGEVVFEHDPDSFFCKDFSVDDNFIYIVGGSVNKRDVRNRSRGVVFVLDKTYSLLEKKEFPDSGGFCGCLLRNKDLTKVFGSHQ